MNKNKKYLIIDTETCGDVRQPIPYDIGYVITDKEGTIYKQRSFIIADIFFDLSEAVQTCYYKEKLPSYWNDIKTGRREVKTCYQARQQILTDMRELKCATVCAYNAGFDRKALNNLIRYTTKSKYRWFFPFGTDFQCIWNMACQVLLNSINYAKFAYKNDLVSGKGNLQTSAEACYRYITGKVDFTEEHKGLEDVLIEKDIFVKCLKTHKRMERKINGSCWRIPQKKNIFK